MEGWQASLEASGRVFRHLFGLHLRGPARRVLIVSLVLLGFITVLLVVASLGDLVGGPQSAVRARMFGCGLLSRYLFFQVAFMLAVVPGLSVRTIFSERHERALDGLLATPPSPWSILLGQALVPMSLGAVIVLSGIPIYLLCMAAGGISALEILAILVMEVATLVLSAGVGVCSSSFSKSTATASLLSYGAVFAGVCGIPLLIQSLPNAGQSGTMGSILTRLNPLVGPFEIALGHPGVIGEFFSARQAQIASTQMQSGWYPLVSALIMLAAYLVGTTALLCASSTTADRY